MPKYKVTVYEQPFEYEVDAENEKEAESKGSILHNVGDFNEIYKIEARLLDEEGEEADTTEWQEENWCRKCGKIIPPGNDMCQSCEAERT